MGKSKSPAVLFYTSDFLTGSYTMTLEQRGAYITLLCLQHQQGHLPPSDVENITNDPKVLSKFLTDEDGNYYNEVMEMRSNERKEYCESRSKNRVKRGNDGERYEKHMKNISKTYVQHMENENEDVSVKDVSLSFDFDSRGVDVDVEGVDVKGVQGELEKGAIFGDMPSAGATPRPDPTNARGVEISGENGGILGAGGYGEAVTAPTYHLDPEEWQAQKAKKDGFERFWAVYPCKKGKDKAWAAWEAAVDVGGVTPDVIIDAVVIAKSKDSRFREVAFTPHPASWLKEGGWKNEYDENETKGGQIGGNRGNPKIDDIHRKRYGSGLL